MQDVLSHPRPALSLKQWLSVDALTCVITGAVLVAGSGWLAGLLGLPAALLFYAGVVLFPCAALMWWISRTQSRAWVWLVVAGNVAWAAASVVVAFALEPTAVGFVFTLAQAVVVALLALMEWRALR